jgi:NlpC/P60 family putative phage cell wall peptidase
MVDLRTAAIVEARTWIGTPYKHQHSTKGAGCDCLGLLRGVYREIIGPEPETTPAYSPMWGEVGRSEPLLQAASRHLIHLSHYSPGDVLVFRLRDGYVAKHVGIVSGPNTMIHAYQGAGRVVEGMLTPYWKRHVAGAFTWPQLH